MEMGVGMWLMMLWIYAIPLVLYFMFALPALFSLRTRHLDDGTRAVWSLTIVAVPIMGVVAFAVMQPGRRPR